MVRRAVLSTLLLAAAPMALAQSPEIAAPVPAGEPAGVAGAAAPPPSDPAPVALSGGFAPDPLLIAFESRGDAPAATIVRGCPGFAPAVPAVVVDLADAVAPLRVYARGAGLAGLIVEAPDGVARCAPADAGGVAHLRPERAASGLYRLSPLAAEPGAAVAGEAFLSETDIDPAAFGPDGGGSGGSGGATVTLGVDAPPAAGRFAAPAGEGSLTVALDLAAIAPAADAAPGCSGWIDPERPDMVLALDAPAPGLGFSVESEADTTLLVLAPDGSYYCNDDAAGMSPQVFVENAPAGDWLVWAGIWGVDAAAAALTVSLGPPPAAEAAAPPVVNPFVGREVASAREALSVLMTEDGGLGDRLEWETLEETGPEGFVLTGVRLHDPDGGEPLPIARVVVSDLDLAGLATHGAPGRFAIALEGVDYARLAAAAETANAGFQAPVLATPATIDLRLSLAPPAGDAARRDFRLGVAMAGQGALEVSMVARWPEDGAPPDAPEGVPLERIELELRDEGYFAAALRAAAAAEGAAPEAMVDAWRAQLAALFEGAVAGDARDRLRAALDARLAGFARPGSLRLKLVTADGLAAGALPLLLADPGGAAPEGFDLEAEFVPAP